MNEFKLRAEDGSWPRFGDYAVVEQKRHFSSNEMYYHKVVATLESNSWVDVPVQSPATESLHDTSERIAIVICCGVDESKIYRVRVADLHKVEVASRPGEAMSGWIKCSDRLPVCGYVLTYRPSAPSGNKIATLNYDSHQERFGGQYLVTHWQPLPSPPTE